MEKKIKLSFWARERSYFALLNWANHNLHSGSTLATLCPNLDRFQFEDES